MIYSLGFEKGSVHDRRQQCAISSLLSSCHSMQKRGESVCTNGTTIRCFSERIHMSVQVACKGGRQSKSKKKESQVSEPENVLRTLNLASN